MALIPLWAAVSCLSLGLGSAFIGQRFNLLSIALILLGAGAGIFFFVRIFDSGWKRSALRAFAAAVPLVLLVGVNFLAHRLPWRWDLTKAKQHTLSNSTADILRDLKQDVEFTAFFVGYTNHGTFSNSVMFQQTTFNVERTDAITR